MHGKTQNANESLNGMIWNRVPKATYVGIVQLELAVYDAVATFNVGRKATLDIFDKLNITVGDFMLIGCSEQNKIRVRQAENKNTEKQKQRRKVICGAKKRKSDKLSEIEGKTYEAGGFT